MPRFMKKFKSIYTKIVFFILLIAVACFFLFWGLYQYKSKTENQIITTYENDLKSDVGHLTDMSSSSMKQIVHDASFWTEFSNAVLNNDKVWCKQNLLFGQTYQYDYTCVYNKNFNIVFQEGNKKNFPVNAFSGRDLKVLNKILVHHFYCRTSDGLLEIYATSIHPSNDPQHTKTKASGYLIVGRLLSPVYLQKLAKVCGAKADIVANNVKVLKNNNDTIHTLTPLIGQDGKVMANIVFSRILTHSFAATQNMGYIIFAFAMLVLLIAVIFVRTNIHNPLKLVTEILKSEDMNSIEALKKYPAEFGKIGQLFEYFVIQKQELLDARLKSHESDKHTRAILRTIPDMIFVQNLDGVFLEYHVPELRDLYVVPSLFIGKKMEDILPPEVVSIVKKVFKNAIATHEIQSYEYALNANGSELYFEGKATLFDENKILSTIRDVTERKTIEKQLIIAKEHSEESDRLKTAFLANMSHEIRTPMNGILGFAELLKQPDLSSAVQLKYINIIESSGMRMLNIVNDIVDISKIEAGLMEINKVATSVNDHLENLHAFFTPETNKKGIKLEFKCALPTSEACIITDSEKLYGILTNLIKNAIKFTDNGYIKFGYELIKREALTYLEFYVKDSGNGIPIDRQEAVFGRFIQADISNKAAYQGAGLGLSISKAYVEMLGGTIWLESEPEKGSTFYFTIPYIVVQCDEVPAKIPITEKTKFEQLSKLKILIVEDDEGLEFLLTETVKEYCDAPLIARNGEDAVAICSKNSDLNLILMDIRMPKMDGYEATAEIRKFNQKVPIIAQTACVFSSEQEKAIEAGCNDYVSKPIDYDVLKSIIEKHLS